AFIEERAADEVVRIACPAVLRISGGERAKRRDRLVILPGFPQVESVGVSLLSGIAFGDCGVAASTRRWRNAGRASLGRGRLARWRLRRRRRSRSHRRRSGGRGCGGGGGPVVAALEEVIACAW